MQLESGAVTVNGVRGKAGQGRTNLEFDTSNQTEPRTGSWRETCGSHPTALALLARATAIHCR
jgi:hypothetical protein